MIGSFCQIQSTSNAPVSRGPLLCSQTEQSLKSRHGLVTPIVGKNEFVEVDLQLCPAYSVVGADQTLLNVSNGPISKWHNGFVALTQFGCHRLSAGDV